MLRAIDWKKEFSDKEKKIYIRPMTYGDVPDFVRWRNSEEVRKFYIYRGVFTVESQTAWMKANIDTGRAASMIVCEEENDRPIGCVYLQNIDKTHNKAEYGVLIGEEDARGHGYGARIAGLMLKFAFEELKLHRVYLRALEGNERAIKGYVDAGFEKEGFLKDDVFIDGEYRNVIWMAAVNRKKQER